MHHADPIERQVLRVRRWRNSRELQRALFALVAIAAGSAAIIVVLALLASPRLFAVATWSAAGTIAVTATLLARALRRRWLGADDAAAWIDERAHLGGRLSTLVAVRARTEGDTPFFLPLLIEETQRALGRWRPQDLVRRRVPLAALSSALATTIALVLALVLAPRLRPPLPEIAYSDEPVAGGKPTAPDGVPDRVVVAPPRDKHAAGDDQGSEDAAGDDGDGTDALSNDSALARLSGALQDRIRRDLWGREWQRAHDAMARAAREGTRGASDARRTGDGDDGDARDTDGGDERWETAGLPSAQRSGRRGSSAGGTRGEHAAESSDADAEARGLGDDDPDGEVGRGVGEPVAGAGNETDPHLFGAPTNVDPHGSASFELAISAPVRAQRSAPRRGSGDPPPASDDTHPELTRAARQEHAIRRMPVPSGYEAIVREVFAHRDAPQDPHP
jgi:hypothetical protein